MKYAVVVYGGKQYRVTEGSVIDVERISPLVKGEFTFDTVILYHSDDTFLFGKPNLYEVAVKGTVIGDRKGQKIRVATYKAKVRNRTVHGHRQYLTRIQIQTIHAGEKTPRN